MRFEILAISILSLMFSLFFVFVATFNIFPQVLSLIMGSFFAIMGVIVFAVGTTENSEVKK